ncbi:hypothetical protein ACNTMW_28285 [Planosporangium sp. 12N6]|uniref:hypothetical protein n=1 Tax=Planosporangium spinosum TaxID=3402278 RepID=UPI003CEF5D0F
MKRGVAGIILLTVILAACARPGRDGAAVVTPPPESTPSGSAPPGSAPPGSAPSLASCVKPAAAAGRSTGAPSPTPAPTGPDLPTAGPLDEQQRAEQFRRNKEANGAFRGRRPLSPAVEAANQPCADTVRAGLDALHRQQRYDPDAVEQVLASAGLTGVVARPPGRLDLGGSGGLVFAGSTGQGCVFGRYGPDGTSVEFGSGIADGGCLPAPD